MSACYHDQMSGVMKSQSASLQATSLCMELDACKVGMHEVHDLWDMVGCMQHHAHTQIYGIHYHSSHVDFIMEV